MRCLVTGATGYLGGRLVPRLLAAGHRVTCLARNPDKLRDVPWARQVRVVTGDVLDADAMAAACADVDILYYLVHSLSTHGFAATDRRAALIVAQAARDAGLRRIVYLGGLHPDPADGGPELSEHLASRTEVGEIFLRSGVPTVVLQAAVILGSGSASFEMLRYLTERLPAMIAPRWVHSRVQPIAVRDVLRYLVGCAGLPGRHNRTFDIGGPDVLTYLEMMQRYAAVAELPRRRIVPVPVLSPRLSSHWVNVITPVPGGLARPLVESLVHDMVCGEHDLAALIPDPPEGLCSYEQAVRLALAKIRNEDVETRWSGASVPDAPSDPLPTDPDWSGGAVYSDERELRTAATPARVWQVVEGIGGEHGWYSFPLAWSARGWLDRFVGGVGLRRGRRDPARLHVGDALDWWRVEALEPGSLVRLRAEMKLPGRGWLELAVTPESAEPAGGGSGGGGSGGGSVYRQRAVFLPRGLAGHAYWLAMKPFHGIVFGGMARNITRAAERAARDGFGGGPAASADGTTGGRRRRGRRRRGGHRPLPATAAR